MAAPANVEEKRFRQVRHHLLGPVRFSNSQWSFSHVLGSPDPTGEPEIDRTDDVRVVLCEEHARDVGEGNGQLMQRHMPPRPAAKINFLCPLR